MKFDYRTFEQWARPLLENCDETHIDCRAPCSSFLPKRILRIEQHPTGGESLIRLHQSLKSNSLVPPVRYSALSYCWGGEQAPRLDAGTESLLEKGVSLGSLAKTIQDAISATASLGLDYIWIDCLCIFQDNDADKAAEIATIPTIFGNAYVTIVASRARHAREGFLQPIARPPVGSVVYKVPYKCSNGDVGTFFLYSRELQERHEPVQNRSWTFPEFMLSRPSLAFTSYQLQWKCRMAGEYQFHPVWRAFDDFGLYEVFHSGERSERAWEQIILHFTSKQLTYPVDTLPAISGIAEIWAKSVDDKYVAGLWLSQLPSTLFWARDYQKETISKNYLAPTWSWASCPNGSCFLNRAYLICQPVATVISCHTTPTYADAPYGAVSSGVLKIKGLMKPAFWPLSTHKDMRKLSDTIHLNLVLALVNMDYVDEISSDLIGGSEVYCLQIFPCTDATHCPGIWGPAGLILRKEQSQYYRLGSFIFVHSYCKADDSSRWCKNHQERNEYQRTAFSGSVEKIIEIL